MLAIDELEERELRDVQIACKYLFPPELATSSQFIASLNSETIKKAYRAKAKRYHPDLHRGASNGTIERRIRRFKNIQRSYKLLISNLKERAPGKLIAVGGAKGGIGKSLFAANLGVILSSAGLKTIVVDLDLGGANLHFYLGETALDKKINDFLNGTRRRPATTRLGSRGTSTASRSGFCRYPCRILATYPCRRKSKRARWS